jgi:preprotein translocase subunit YajC
MNRSLLIPSFAFFLPQIAAADAGQAVGSPYSSVLLLGGFLVMFYFMFIRPQNRRAREHRELLSNVAQGDVVATTGGLIGIVRALEEQFLTLAVSRTVDIKVQKQAINAVLPKGTLEFND